MKTDKIKKEGGFLKLIIIIVIALILLKYYHVTFYDVLAWVKSLSIDKIIGTLTKIFNWIAQLLKGFFAK